MCMDRTRYTYVAECARHSTRRAREDKLMALFRLRLAHSRSGVEVDDPVPNVGLLECLPTRPTIGVPMTGVYYNEETLATRPLSYLELLDHQVLVD